MPPLLVGLSLGGYASLAYARRARAQDRRRGPGGLLDGDQGQAPHAYRRAAGSSPARCASAAHWHVVTDMLTSLAGYSPLADLRRTAVPVWLVNGSRDPLRLDERRYLEARPGARLTVVPRAGHDVNAHAPVAFNRVLLDALHELRHRGGLAVARDGRSARPQ